MRIEHAATDIDRNIRLVPKRLERLLDGSLQSRDAGARDARRS